MPSSLMPYAAIDFTVRFCSSVGMNFGLAMIAPKANEI
jgi:hypothetical protein